MNDSLQVLPLRGRKDREVFLHLPWKFYRDLPAWVPPMIFDIRGQIDPKKGDYFKTSSGEFFLAWRGSEPVGRIGAFHNTKHLAAHPDGAGFFGFFECEDNLETARALLAAAEAWLRASGLTTMRGPANFSIQDEAGVLLDGFEHAPMAGMAYTPPYYKGLLEAAGLHKAKDLHVFRIDRASFKQDQFDRMCAVADRIAEGVKIRPIDMSNLPKEAGALASIFDEAWADNWGAQPISQVDFLKYASQYRLFIDPQLVLFAERDGKELAMMLAIPNMNEIIKRIDGKLFPFGWWHLLAGRKKCKSVRLFLLGVRKDARRLGIPVLFIRRYHELLLKIKDGTQLEFSWILEDNHETLALIERVGGWRAQTLRLYEKSIA
jgi:GNAT superfamily N-acetyltransferase